MVVPFPVSSNVPYSERKNRAPYVGIPASPSLSLHGGSVFTIPTSPPPSANHPSESLAVTPARRHLLIRRPTPQSPDEIDIKPYSTLIPPPTGSTRASSMSPNSQSDLLGAFGKFRSERMHSKDIASLIESSDRMQHDKTAQILRILRNPLTPPHNPDLAGVDHRMPVRRFYTINQMFSQMY